jgi:hypothetical protein
LHQSICKRIHPSRACKDWGISNRLPKEEAPMQMQIQMTVERNHSLDYSRPFLSLLAWRVQGVPPWIRQICSGLWRRMMLEGEMRTGFMSKVEQEKWAG